MITNRYLACLTEWETNSCKSNTQRFLSLWVILRIYHFFCYYIFHLVRALCLVNLAIVFHCAKFKSLLELEHFPQIEPSDLINITLTSFSGPYWKLRSLVFFPFEFIARLLIFSARIYGPYASPVGHKADRKKTRSVTYSMELELGQLKGNQKKLGRVRNEDDVRDVWQSVVYICPSLDEVRNAMMFLTWIFFWETKCNGGRF